MMDKTLIIIALTAAVSFGAAKERPWEDGRILDTRDNPYFKGQEAVAIDGTKPLTYATNDQFNMTQNSGSGNTVYNHYVIEGKSAGYLVEFGHLKSYPAPQVTPRRPIKFAVEKSKLWFRDEHNQEYETQILKTVPRQVQAVTQAVEPTPAAAPVAPAPAPKPVQPEPVVVAKQEAPPVVKPTPVPEPVAVKQEPPPPPKALPMQESLVVAKAEVKETPVVVKQPQVKPEPVVKQPQPQVATASNLANGLKDRPWQSGQLLSTAANRFFANIAYTTETDASTWTFALGSDGKSTAFIHAAAPAGSSYIFDNYVIETEFCGYLVQRSRLRTVPPARFPATKPLRFAIEKTKIWIVDEDGKEYEGKIVKQIQKDPDAEAQAGVRTAVR
jgi:hypothetical protein